MIPRSIRLENDADSANQDIRVAVARVDQAEAAARYSRSFLSPTLSLGTSVSRTREAQNRPNNGNTNGRAATYNDFQLPLSSATKSTLGAACGIRWSLRVMYTRPRSGSALCALVGRGRRGSGLLQFA